MSALLSVERIDALLPQTQCGKCGHPGCLPYARGIAHGEAINKCPPGGQETVQALAELLELPALPLAEPPMTPRLAFIREDECIGCTKCIQACPVDAILGAAKLMHTVIADECSGCELCVAPCPVDCIDILPLAGIDAERQRQRAPQFRQRHQSRLQRLEAINAQRLQRPALQSWAPPTDDSPAAEAPNSALAGKQKQTSDPLKQARIAAAMAKAQLTRALKAFGPTPDNQQLAQLQQLGNASEQADKHLSTLLSSTSAADTTGAAGNLLKQAKVQLVNSRAALKKAEREGLAGAPLSALQKALEDAQNALHQAEANSGKPAPDLVRNHPPGVSPQSRALKTELAYARADLKRLERRNDVGSSQLEAARQRLADAQQRLNDHCD